MTRIIPWEDPGLDAVGIDPRSTYVELFWLPVLGPSATWLLRRLAELLAGAPEGVDVDLADLACCIGVGGPGSKHAPLDRALRRCARFGMARPARPGAVAVRRRIGPLPRQYLIQLPGHLQREHARWESQAQDSAAARRRARLVASELSSVGEDRCGVERRLLGLGMHPALAYEAAGWAGSLRALASPASAPALEGPPPS